MNFLDFLREYKDTLIGVVCLLSTILCILLKRKPKTLDEFLSCLTEVLNKVPEMIISVERAGAGQEKKREVMKSCRELLAKKLSRDLSEQEVKLLDNYVSSEIELVLSTPRKKDIIL